MCSSIEACIWHELTPQRRDEVVVEQLEGGVVRRDGQIVRRADPHHTSVAHAWAGWRSRRFSWPSTDHADHDVTSNTQPARRLRGCTTAAGDLDRTIARCSAMCMGHQHAPQRRVTMPTLNVEKRRAQQQAQHRSGRPKQDGQAAPLSARCKDPLVLDRGVTITTQRHHMLSPLSVSLRAAPAHAPRERRGNSQQALAQLARK